MNIPFVFLLLALFTFPSMGSAMDQYMKGAELYAWEAPTGLARYSLLAGTNRLKTQQEIEFAGKELNEMIRDLYGIPKGTHIFMHNGPWPGAETKSLRWHKPTKAEWRKIRKAAKARGLELED